MPIKRHDHAVVRRHTPILATRTRRSSLSRTLSRERASEHKFGEVLVPTEQVVEVRDGQKKTDDPQGVPWLYVRTDGYGQ